ncbi:MAG: hypothetical protein RLZZ574_641 [Cyanobacteriota bacterium]|jgi:hypothetical protein
MELTISNVENYKGYIVILFYYPNRLHQYAILFKDRITFSPEGYYSPKSAYCAAEHTIDRIVNQSCF